MGRQWRQRIGIALWHHPKGRLIGIKRRGGVLMHCRRHHDEADVKDEGVVSPRNRWIRSNVEERRKSIQHINMTFWMMLIQV